MSPWWVCIPSVPAADPAWPLVVLDVLHPVADDTPPVLDDTLPLIAGVLNDHLPLVAGVLLPAAGVLPSVTPVHDNNLSLIDPVLEGYRPAVERAVQRRRLADPASWSYSSLLG